MEHSHFTNGEPMPDRHVAIYIRVSTIDQDLRSQTAELERWQQAYATGPVVWYRDQASGASMDRPAWNQLLAAVRCGQVERVVVWRLDRLGRTAAGLTALFEELRRLAVPLVSMREGIDLATPAGNMMATIIASVAQYEREVFRERQAAGIAAAKAQGKRWGGRNKGERYKVTPELERQIRRMNGAGEGVTTIARVCHLSRPTVYRVLREANLS